MHERAAFFALASQWSQPNPRGENVPRSLGDDQKEGNGHGNDSLVDTGKDGAQCGVDQVGSVRMTSDDSLPPNRIPIEHSSAEIVATEGKDPFLYNPRLRAAEGKVRLQVVKLTPDCPRGKRADGRICDITQPVCIRCRTSRCLLDVGAYEVSANDRTSGVGFTTNPLSINLPANSIQAIRITGVATSAGSLQIRGVSLRLADGSSAEFLLPLLNDTDRQKRDKRKSRLTADLSKAKKQGMEARWSMQSIPSDESVEKWMECKVVEEQPLVWIKKTSLTHGTVMLYNGERLVYDWIVLTPALPFESPWKTLPPSQ